MVLGDRKAREWYVHQGPVVDRDAGTVSLPLGDPADAICVVFDIGGEDRVRRQKWYRGGTVKRPVPITSLLGQTISMGRFLLDAIPRDRVTFQDNDPLNCRRSNMRYHPHGEPDTRDRRDLAIERRVHALTAIQEFAEEERRIIERFDLACEQAELDTDVLALRARRDDELAFLHRRCAKWERELRRAVSAIAHCG